jgi:hypothetical protein
MLFADGLSHVSVADFFVYSDLSLHMVSEMDAFLYHITINR